MITDSDVEFDERWREEPCWMKESESSGDEKRNAWLAETASRCRAWPAGKVESEC